METRTTSLQLGVLLTEAASSVAGVGTERYDEHEPLHWGHDGWLILFLILILIMMMMMMMMTIVRIVIVVVMISIML